MTPSKVILYFGAAVFFSLSFYGISFSDTNSPARQSVVVQPLRAEDVTIQNNPVIKENLPSREEQPIQIKNIDESILKPDKHIYKPSPVEESLYIMDLNSTDKPVVLGEGDSIKNPESGDLNKYDMPITVNRAVEKNMNYFKYSLYERFGSWLNRSGRYLSLMREIFQEKGLPQDLVYLALIESGFNPYAYSWARAVGPWQFISSTAKRYGLKVNWWVDERRDPVKSTIAAAEYLKDLYELFGSWNLAMAGYNAGERKVLKGLRKIKGGDFWDLRDTRYLKRETKEYVPKYMAATIIAKDPEVHGFVVDYHEPFQYDEITVNSPIDLEVIAKSAETTIDEIKTLNPELRRWCTPPDQTTYKIRIPVGKKEIFIANLENIPKDERFTGRIYRVKKGDTLDKIAKYFSVSKKNIIYTNSLGKKYKVKPGDVLLIPGRDRSTLVAGEEKKEITKKDIDQKKIVYLVKKGDNLSKIAQRYNTSPEKIKEWNRLTDGRLKPGDRLYIFTSLDSPAFF